MDLTQPGSLLALAVGSSATLAAAVAIVHWRKRDAAVQLPLSVLSGLSLALTAAHLAYGDGGPTAATWGLVEIAGLLMLLVVLVRRARPWTATWAGATAATAVTTMLLRVRTIDAPADLLLCLFWLPFVLAAVAAGSYLRMQDVAHRRAVDRARTEQRLALAADLHDFVAHEVSAMLFQAQAARMLGPDDTRSDQALERIAALGQRALASLDRSVSTLRDPDGDRRRMADVREATQRFSAIGPVTVDLRIAPAAETCSEETVATAHRVVIEALTNVRRHAPGTTGITVDIRPAGRPNALSVVVENTTAGAATYPPPPPRGARAGRGIAALIERVEAQGGTLTAGPRGGSRWRLTAVIPTGRVRT